MKIFKAKISWNTRRLDIFFDLLFYIYFCKEQNTSFVIVQCQDMENDFL